MELCRTVVNPQYSIVASFWSSLKRVNTQSVFNIRSLDKRLPGKLEGPRIIIEQEASNVLTIR